MGKTVEQLLNEISSAELAEWAAFSRMEPFGPDIENWRSGQVAATIANVHRGPRQRPFKPADFMPAFRRRQTVNEMLEALRMSLGA